jgi:hypothetical protein
MVYSGTGSGFGMNTQTATPKTSKPTPISTIAMSLVRLLFNFDTLNAMSDPLSKPDLSLANVTPSSKYCWLIKRLFYLIQKVWFGHCSDNRSSAVIDRSLWHPTDTMLGGQFWEFHSFDHFRLNHWAFHGHLVSEHHGSRAVWSGRCDENL